MILHLTRDVFTPTTTLGRLSIQYPGPLWYTPGGWVTNEHPGRVHEMGYVCEDEDRGLNATDDLDHIRRVKVPEETAIPAGRYRVHRTWSPRYQRLVMELQNVPGFRGIRIHSGNGESDTAGCLLVGLARDSRRRWVTRSTAACDWLDARVRECEHRGDEVWIEIWREGAPLNLSSPEVT